MIGYPNGLWDKKHNFPIFDMAILLHIPDMTLLMMVLALSIWHVFPAHQDNLLLT